MNNNNKDLLVTGRGSSIYLKELIKLETKKNRKVIVLDQTKDSVLELFLYSYFNLNITNRKIYNDLDETLNSDDQVIYFNGFNINKKYFVNDYLQNFYSYRFDMSGEELDEVTIFINGFHKFVPNILSLLERTRSEKHLKFVLVADELNLDKNNKFNDLFWTTKSVGTWIIS